jgi:Fe-S-cluster containining protein
MNPIESLERQIERGQLYLHTALGDHADALHETSVFLHGVVDLLLAKGLIGEEEIVRAVGGVQTEMRARGERRAGSVAVRLASEDVDAAPPVAVDCSKRMHICKAVCCKLDFALSVDEVERGSVKWDLGRPYFIRHERDGYCTHVVRDGGGCNVYENRPAVCRRYSCAEDTRIWKDFDAMELNEEWLAANLHADHPVLAALMMNDADLITPGS